MTRDDLHRQRKSRHLGAGTRYCGVDEVVMHCLCSYLVGIPGHGWIMGGSEHVEAEKYHGSSGGKIGELAGREVPSRKFHQFCTMIR